MDDQVKSRKRSRRRGRVGNVPNLSIRLNPDFNIQHVIPQPNIHVKGDYNENIEELDPRSMDFDTLADMLHPSFIYDYLLKTLHFLESDVKDLCFPNIAPYKQEFLVKIVQKPGRLRSKIFNDKCEAVATEILKVLKENQHLYQWVHSYDYYRTMDKTVLVYKKMYFGENKHQPDMAAPAVSLASSLEDLSLTSERQEFDPRFKTHILNITMKFIKDITQLDLKYPELILPQAQYVYSLLQQLNKEELVSSVGFGFKSLFTPLYNAMKEARQSYEFEVSFVETRNLETAQILLRKKPKFSGSHDVIQKNGVDTTQSNPKYNLPTISRRTNKRENPLEYAKGLIASVPTPWVRSSLGQIAKFVGDPQRASLEMNMLSEKQASFLELVPLMCEDLQYHQYLDYECGDLLTKIGKPRGFKLQVFYGNQGGKMKTKNRILFEKVPDFPEKLPAEVRRTISPARNESDSLERKTQSPVENESNWRSSSKDRKTVSSADNESSQRNVNKDQKSRNYSITFQSAGSEVTDSEVKEVTNEVSESARWSQSGRVGKLMEAMCTPLESDRATRMMRMMGWDGGALGLRGDGITEPIMPALHLAPGAGLGHVKTKKQPLPPSSSSAGGHVEFRATLLNDMLSFLRSPDKDIFILFPQPLDKKRARFLKPTVKAFNNRSNISLSSPEEISLVNTISEEMRKDLSLLIICQLSNDKKELYLAKTKGDPSAIKLPKNVRKTNQSNTDSPTVASLPNPDSKEIVDPEQLLTLNTRLSLEASCPTKNAAKKLAYKLLFLEKIKEFMSNQDGVAEYKFDIALTRRHRTYIEGIVNDINKKGTRKIKFSALENTLHKEIIEKAGDCYVTVTFIGMSILLQKKYYQKRFINSALELPPPKSTDVKNTIIYVNNVPVNPETYNDTADDKVENGLTDTEDLVDTDLESKNSNESTDLSDEDSIIFSETLEETLIKKVNNPAENKDKLEASSKKLEKDLKEISKKPEVNNNSNIFNDMIETVDISSDVENIEKDIDNDLKLYKRSLNNSNPNFNSKKYKLTEKYLKITSLNNKDITIQLVKQVQTMISENILSDFTSESLPCLECYGIQNGGLIYRCQDEKSFDWLQKALSVASDVIEFSIIDYKHEYTVHKMILKCNSFILLDSTKVFELLEKYNSGLNTVDWVVLHEKIEENCALLTVNVDENSLNFIRSHTFSLNAGVDKIRFSICWD